MKLTLAERILELRLHGLRDAKIEALAQEVLDLQEDSIRLTRALSGLLPSAGASPPWSKPSAYTGSG